MSSFRNLSLVQIHFGASLSGTFSGLLAMKSLQRATLPILTYLSPQATTSYAGLDAFAQAIDGMIARSRAPHCDVTVVEEVHLITRSLAIAN